MKLKPGDKVRFLDGPGEGTVTYIIDSKEVLVLLDGIEIPFKVSILVKSDPELAQSVNQNPFLTQETDRPKGKKATGRRSRKESHEVDLHIGELVDNRRGMSNGEMLTIQLNHFQFWMDKAMRENIRNLIFIHGVGNGILKSEIRRLIRTYPGVRFEDASYQRYGFGATEVLFY